MNAVKASFETLKNFILRKYGQIFGELQLHFEPLFSFGKLRRCFYLKKKCKLDNLMIMSERRNISESE